MKGNVNFSHLPIVLISKKKKFSNCGEKEENKFSKFKLFNEKLIVKS